MSLRNSYNNGFTGRLLEAAFAPPCATNGQKGYMDYDQALRLVRETQPDDWDPVNPPTRNGNDLHALVCEQLGVSNYSQVRFYTALGSPLDVFHGADFVFEYDGHVTTVDITTNGHKADGYKADVVVYYTGPESLRQSAQDIADSLRSPRSFMGQRNSDYHRE